MDLFNDNIYPNTKELALVEYFFSLTGLDMLKIIIMILCVYFNNTLSNYLIAQPNTLSDQHVEQFEDHDFICPITHMVFKKPVLADDGHFYEKLALTQWFENSNKSPLTGLKIRNTMKSCVYFNKRLKNYLIAHPDKLKDQFIEDFVEEFNDEEFYQLFTLNKIDELVIYMSQYDTFSLQLLDYRIFKNETIVKILIDKNVFIENSLFCTNYLPCLICDYSTPKMIKYLIDNNINYCGMRREDRLIHYICEKSTPEIITYIIDKGVNLECVNFRGERPIHLICRKSTPDMIKYIIDKGVNLECANDDGWRPIHFICERSTPDMIKYIIDKGVDLECQTEENWRPIHFICQNSTPEMITYIIDKGVDLECQTYKNWRPIHFICQNSTPEMLKYIIAKGADVNARVSRAYKNVDVNGRVYRDYSVHDIIDIRFKNAMRDFYHQSELSWE
jgi:uncharacterized protein (DUF2237 family)